MRARFDHARARDLRARRIPVPAIASALGVDQRSIARVVRGVLPPDEVRALRAQRRRETMLRLWADPDFREAQADGYRASLDERRFQSDEGRWQ